MRRHLRRTSITIFSIAFGLAVILWLQCILAGRNQNIIETITATHIGHLQIYNKKYPKEHLIQFSFPKVPDFLNGVLPRGASYAPRINLPSLVSSGEQSMPILLEGIDPVLEGGAFRIASSLVEGEYLTQDTSPNCDLHQAYIGRSLAEILNVKVGNKIVILAQAADGSLGNEMLRVKGVFDTGSPEFDKGMVFSTLNCASKIGSIQGIHEVAIQFADTNLEKPLKAAIAEKLSSDLMVTSWSESMPRMMSIVKYNDATLILVSAMLFIVITMGIINTLLVSVFERTKEFGVMAALGVHPNQIISVVVMESVFIGLFSIILGILFGLSAVLYHQKFGFDVTPLVGKELTVGSFKMDLMIYPLFKLTSFLKSVTWTLVFIVGAAAFPAWRASRLSPIEAMRGT